MRILFALGGNALLRRGERLTVENQRRNVEIAAQALAPLVAEHELVISHGNGPQVGLLAQQGYAYNPDETIPLDILDAETEGMIGYLIEQELSNHLPADSRCATLLTQVEIDPRDPAFNSPTKPIGPIYNESEGQRLEHEAGWSFIEDSGGYRRVVPSPQPKRILQLSVIKLLVDEGVIVICAGGGGIPTIRGEDGRLTGVDAVIDKDLTSSILAQDLRADAFIMLTDVAAVWTDWGETGARAIRRISPSRLRTLPFAPGSMGPKTMAAIEFVERTGGFAGIGQLKDAAAILRGAAGTLIAEGAADIEYWD